MSNQVASGEQIIDAKYIRANPNQPRSEFDQSKLDELAQSIASGGQEESIAVMPLPENDGIIEYEILSGERRWRACKQIKKPLRCSVRPFIDDPMERLLVEAIFNFNREDLTPLDQMSVITRLMDGGYDTEKIATSFGKSTTWVYQRKGLSNLHPSLQRLMRNSVPKNKRLKITDAISLSQLNHKSQLAVLKSTKTYSGTDSAPPPMKDRLTQAVREQYSRTPDASACVPRSLRGKNSDQVRVVRRITANLDEQFRRLGDVAILIEDGEISSEMLEALQDLEKRFTMLQGASDMISGHIEENDS